MLTDPIAGTDPGTRILLTGGNGFVGGRVLRALLEAGFVNIVCVTRSSGGSIAATASEFPDARVDVVEGNLLSQEVCAEAARGAGIVYHLAAGRGRNFSACVLNTVVTTRNLLDALVADGSVQRFVNVSSMSVFSNADIARRGPLEADSPVDREIAERHDPYAYAKALQDDLVERYASEQGLRTVTICPGFVIGPGKPAIPGRVGNGAFGVFLQIGRGNQMPFTYVDNCADAIVLAGLVDGVEGERFIIVDDDLPTGHEYLRRYKDRVGWFPTLTVPYGAFYGLSGLLERYSRWSEGQLPMTFNRRSARTYYKGNTYSNAKAKQRLGWSPRISMDDALERCFAYIRSTKGTA
ncbi:NAD-dependent epimerase/dehydratase family protein [Solicola sp. PLA-1-18]|uniref:NAD-dependent epimerase/dehydratase family protein n=1 Tax=Solicola sp. PLA-1-18 TaxID=3380532 RepID=UPI003B80313F